MRAAIRVLSRVGIGVAAGAAAAFVAALLRPQRRAETHYVAPVPPGELKV
jgi:pimeloyl-ACP methyl ester carboxylesterase